MIGDKDVYAIDNGLSFPNRTRTVRSEPARIFLDKYGDQLSLARDIPNLVKEIDPDIIHQLTAVSKKNFMNVFEHHGLSIAGREAWKRLNKLVQAAKLKPKHIKTIANRIAAELISVSELPNDVMEDGYPQEYLSPSPSEVGSVRPGDDKLLTGKTRRGKL
jgi:hypothetical protein